MQQLVNTFNKAADNFNLARLEYALQYRASAPPPALRLPSDDRQWSADQRPVAFAVEAVRDYFESVADGNVIAQTDSESYERMRAASLELVRRFFRVSLTQLGIPCDDILEVSEERPPLS